MIYSIGNVIDDITKLHWQSDWSGDEVGYPEIDIVGLYTDFVNCFTYYINMETNQVLEVFDDSDCDDDCEVEEK